MSKMLTAERARELLSYDPKTGVLRNRTNRSSNARAGAEAGHIRSNGYRSIWIDGRDCLAHCLAFLIVTGRWPHETDHINGVRDDNRWSNLRETDSQGNKRNQCLRKDNASGCPGVHRSKRNGKLIAEIWINSRKKHLGCFDDKADAIAARKAAEAEYGFHENHGREAEQREDSE